MKKYIWILSIYCFSLMPGCNSNKQEYEAAGNQHAKTFQREITTVITGKYLLFLPKDYYQDQKDRPMILFLHGSEIGDNDPDMLRKKGPPRVADEWDDFLFILVSPLNSLNYPFTSDLLDLILDDVLSKYRVDENRIYVTGVDWGGLTTWKLAVDYPNRFAAIAPGACPGMPDKADQIKHVPVWVFHGTDDSLIPISRPERMVKTLEKHGCDVKYTFFQDEGHDITDKMYQDLSLYEWFLSHSLKKNE